MADNSLAGYEFPAFFFRVERVKINEFVTAIGDDNPIFLDSKAAQKEGYGDTPCPPTFFSSAFQEFSGAYFRAFETLGVSLASVLHGEEEYEYLGEIYPGDVLECRMRVESIVEKQTKTGKMDLITLRTLFSNQRGQDVLQAKSLIIERN